MPRRRRSQPKQFVVRKVQGDALLPELSDGQLVICRQAVEPHTGDVVLVSKDGEERIERVIRHQGNVLYFVGPQLIGTEGEWLAAKYVVAKVVWPAL